MPAHAVRIDWGVAAPHRDVPYDAARPAPGVSGAVPDAAAWDADVTSGATGVGYPARHVAHGDSHVSGAAIDVADGGAGVAHIALDVRPTSIGVGLASVDVVTAAAGVSGAARGVASATNDVGWIVVVDEGERHPRMLHSLSRYSGRGLG
jgi:hypothetical protein